MTKIPKADENIDEFMKENNYSIEYREDFVRVQSMVKEINDFIIGAKTNDK